MNDCGMCGGEIVKGACRNCGTPGQGIQPAAFAPDGVEVVDLPEVGGDLNLAKAGLSELLRAAGEADKAEMANTPGDAVRAILGLTSGNDADPGQAFDSAGPGALATPRVTLSCSVPIRTACERCMLPIFGEVRLLCQPRSRALDGGHLTRLVSILSARHQSEVQLAEQLAAAIVDMGGATNASARVIARRPCDECGAGQALTTARARRAAPAGGDPPRAGGG